MLGGDAYIGMPEDLADHFNRHPLDRGGPFLAPVGTRASRARGCSFLAASGQPSFVRRSRG